MAELHNYPPLRPDRVQPVRKRVFFIAIGCVAALCGILFTLLRFVPGGQMDPPWISDLFGAIFILFGLVIGLPSLRGLLRDRRIRGRPKLKAEPVMINQPWDQKLARDRLGDGFGQSLFSLGFVALFLSPFHFALGEAFSQGVLAGLFVLAILGVFDLIFLFMLVICVHRILPRVKYGRSTIRLKTFPFVLGDDLVVTFWPPSRLHDFKHLTCYLRCLTSKVMLTGNVSIDSDTGASRRQTRVACIQLWSKKQEIERLNVGREVEFRFTLPQDKPESSLNKKEPVYWELEVRAETRGIDYRALFPLPVYLAGGRRRKKHPLKSEKRDSPKHPEGVPGVPYGIDMKSTPEGSELETLLPPVVGTFVRVNVRSLGDIDSDPTYATYRDGDSEVFMELGICDGAEAAQAALETAKSETADKDTAVQAWSVGTDPGYLKEAHPRSGAFFAWTRGEYYFSAHAKGGEADLDRFVGAFPF